MEKITSPLHTAQTPPSNAKTEQREADLRAAARGFESLFIAQVLKSGRAASLGKALGESSAMETTQSLLDMKLSDAGSVRGGLGIAEAVYRQFSTHLDTKTGLDIGSAMGPKKGGH